MLVESLPAGLLSYSKVLNYDLAILFFLFSEHHFLNGLSNIHTPLNTNINIKINKIPAIIAYIILKKLFSL